MVRTLLSDLNADLLMLFFPEQEQMLWNCQICGIIPTDSEIKSVSIVVPRPSAAYREWEAELFALGNLAEHFGIRFEQDIDRLGELASDPANDV